MNKILLVSCALFATQVLFANEKNDKIEIDKIFKLVQVKVQEKNAQAEESYIKGKKLYDTRKYKESAKYFSQALSLNPNHSKARKYYAEANRALGKNSSFSMTAEWIYNSERVYQQEKRMVVNKKVKDAVRNYETISRKKLK